MKDLMIILEEKLLQILMDKHFKRNKKSQAMHWREIDTRKTPVIYTGYDGFKYLRITDVELSR